ncbi:MAG: hypothetical protein L0Y71_06885 [Gemmataceae bacterium]|nr:hypothetical protein [Gemmataceae bacterium]
MPTLFPDFLRSKLDRPNPKGGTYWGAFTRLVDLYDQSPANWVTEKEVGEIARLRQLDKSEPAITYYLFAALAEATNGFADARPVAELLAHAFPADVASEVAQQMALQGIAGLEFEGQIAPNGALREEVQRRVSVCPVAYIRRIAAERKGVRFESATRLDCFIGDCRALGEDAERAPGTFGLGTEAKFTSDIDDETTYSPHRNQIARIVEVGHQRCEQFFFLLIASRSYRQARSRLYVYKMEEYQSDAGVAALRRDILLPQPNDVLRGWVRNMGWLDWEHVVEFLYPAGQPREGWTSQFSGTLQVFLDDRRLWPF